jgi:hypothetical protein
MDSTQGTGVLTTPSGQPPPCQAPAYRIAFSGTNPLQADITVGPLPAGLGQLTFALDLQKELFPIFAWDGNTQGWEGCGNSWTPVANGTGDLMSQIPMPCKIANGISAGLEVRAVYAGVGATLIGNVASVHRYLTSIEVVDANLNPLPLSAPDSGFTLVNHSLTNSIGETLANVAAGATIHLSEQVSVADFAANVADVQEWPGGGLLILGTDGSLYARKGAPYLGSAYGQPYFAGRTAAALVVNAGGYTIVDTAGETYNYGSAALAAQPPRAVALNFHMNADIADVEAWPGGGVLILGTDGSVYAVKGAPYFGGANGQPYFAGRMAAELVVNPGGYTLIDTAGETYNYPVNAPPPPACGVQGQACCADNGCGANLYCAAGTCQAPSPPLNFAVTANVADVQEWPGGGVLILGTDGAIYAVKGAPYLGGANGQPYFAGRTAAELVVSSGGYALVDTAGETYNYGDASLGKQPPLSVILNFHLNANIADVQKWPAGGVLILGMDGSVYAVKGAPYYGGANGQTYFAGRTAVQLIINPEGYTIVDSAGETYNYP